MRYHVTMLVIEIVLLVVMIILGRTERPMMLSAIILFIIRNIQAIYLYCKKSERKGAMARKRRGSLLWAGLISWKKVNGRPSA